MPDQVPSWDDGRLAEHKRRTEELLAQPMPANRIAYHLVTIQVALLIVGLMLWDAATHGYLWADLPIALFALYLGFEAHYRLWRGGR